VDRGLGCVEVEVEVEELDGLEELEVFGCPGALLEVFDGIRTD
jgi:hypothetical protein